MVLTALYVILIAKPMYMAESRFAVRGDNTSSVANLGGITSMLAATGGMAGGGVIDGFAVRDFLDSREAMEQLDAKIHLANYWAGRGWDPVVRVSSSPSREELYDAYQSFVTVRFNMMEQIVVLDTSSFTPEDAVTIGKALVDIADTFANNLNHRALEDALKVYRGEIEVAEKRSLKTRLALAQWRNENKNVDPQGDVAVLSTLIGQLESQLSSAEADLAMIRTRADAATHPRRRATEAQIENLRNKIAGTRLRLAGGEGAASQRMSSYEALRLSNEFADQALTSARQAYEQARVNIIRQQRYVSVVANPVRDTRAAYPNVVTAVGTALLVGVGLAFLSSFVIGLVLK